MGGEFQQFLPEHDCKGTRLYVIDNVKNLSASYPICIVWVHFYRSFHKLCNMIFYTDGIWYLLKISLIIYEL